jgi:hypothetical protein
MGAMAPDAKLKEWMWRNTSFVAMKLALCTMRRKE